MFTFATNKLSIQEVWQQAFDLYKKTISKVWYLAFLMLIVMLAATRIPIMTTIDSIGDLRQSMNFSYVHFIGYFVSVLIAVFVFGLILHFMYNLATDSTFSLNRSVKFVLSKYVTFLFSMILVYVAVFIGGLLFIIPGVFVVILFMFNVPLILFDNEGWFVAIKRSYQLVWGNWWRTFAIFFVPVFIMGFVQYLLEHIFMSTSIALVLVNVIISALILSFIKPYVEALMIVQLNDLKIRKAEQPQTTEK